MNRQIKIYKDAINNSGNAYELIDNLYRAIKETGDEVDVSDYVNDEQTYSEHRFHFKNGLSILLISREETNTIKARMYDDFHHNNRDIIVKTMRLSREAC